MMNALLFWLILMVLFFFAYTMGMRRVLSRFAAQSPARPTIPTEKLAAFESKLEPMMVIEGHKIVGDIIQIEGRLKGEPDSTFRQIREAFADELVTPLLLEGGENNVRVVFLPEKAGEPAAEKPNWILHWLLFIATIATTTWAGALHAGVNLLNEPGRFAVGLPYSFGLMLILGAHELGHYFTAKAHRISVTPPFFIPVPFALGTFGAFIRIKSRTPDRAALFDVAVAGPLVGLVFAVPALLIGLRYSQVIPANAPESLVHTGVSIDSSILLGCLAKMSLGVPLLAGDRLLLHPLAFAGWLGLIVTALNLLPIGQLDGGHMSHALFGSRQAHGISIAALILLFLLALFVWPGLMFWAFIVYFIAGTHDAPAANDVTQLGAARKALGYFTFLLLLLIIVPFPRAFYQTIGLHSPYL